MTKNEIFNYIATNLSSSYYVTAVYEPTPKQCPCVMVRQIGKMRPVENITLNYQDTQHRLTYEVQVISTKKNKAQSEAYKIINEVETLFNNLYFIEDMCEPIEEEASRYRIVARFHRQLGGGEIVPTNSSL